MAMLFLVCGVFFLGLAIGSFLNVVIYRVPRELSIVSPASSCPACGRPIRPWENIPLFSYFVLLRGHCAGCHKPISRQYPAVELITGLIFALVVFRFGLTFQTLVFLCFSAALIALSVIDLQTKLLPDTIILPGLIIACALSILTIYEPFRFFWDIRPFKAFMGMAAGGIPLLFLAWTYMKITGREGMGGGDIKLMFLIGALLGPAAVFLTLFLGSLSGSVVGILYLKLGDRERHTQIPFGPFLSAGAWIAMMWGDQIINFYMGITGINW